MANVAPVTPSERIEAIDIIRGFALLGIFIMNTPAFSSSMFAGADGSHLFNTWYDRAAETVRDLLFSGKFNSMFSLLFAVGFTIQMSRLRAADPARATGIYVRRLLVLLAFGVIHGYFIWVGDILQLYAELGLLLILVFGRLPDRWIWASVALFTMLPSVVNLLRLPQFTPDFMQAQLALAQEFEGSTNRAFGHGSLLDAARENMRIYRFGYADRESLIGQLLSSATIFTTMLLGLLAGRHRLIQRAAELAPLLRKVLWWSLGGGLALGVVNAVAMAHYDPLKITVVSFIAGNSYRLCRIALMVFYVTAILLLLQRPEWQRRFASFGIAGRMPLTNYLLQTVIGTGVFYGWGLGLWGKVGPALLLLFCFAVFFFVQVPLTRWWLARHRQGPMEALWRWLTYGSARRAAPQSA